jgi:hypothetical protein
LEGAAWNKSQRYLEDAKGKDLYYAFPNIKVYADCPAAEQNKGPGAPKTSKGQDEKSMYPCPVYKYNMRSDKYLVTKFHLRAEPQQDNQSKKKDAALAREANVMVNQWRLRGVALLCQKE